MIRSLLCLSIVLAGMAACTNKEKPQEQENLRTIRVEGFTGKEMEVNDWVETRMLALHKDSSECMLGNVKDIAGIDSFIYVLDDVSASVMRFDARTGLQQKIICRRGNGPLEYIQPVALSADSSRLYLLDMGGRSIILYDKELEAERDIRLDFPALDFAKVPGGFLCYNPAASDMLSQVVYVDDHGNVKASFGASEIKQRSTYATEKIFCKDGANRVYCTLPLDRTVYHWNADKETLQPVAAYDYGSNNLPDNANAEQTEDARSEYAIMCEFFCVDQTLVSSFLHGGKRYYNFLLPDSVPLQVGTIKRKPNQLPFFPRWQLGNMLVGSYVRDDTENPSAESGDALLLFTLKKKRSQ